MNAGDDTARLRQAMQLHGQGRRAEAEQIYREVLAHAPEHADALHFLGVLYGQRGNLAEGLALIDRSLAADPRNASALFNRGNTLHALGEREKAIASYDASLALAPDHPGALTNRGVVCLELKQPAEALASFERAMRQRANHAPLLFNRANALRDLGRLDEALAGYSAALALEPRHVDARNNRGNLLKRLRRYGEALADYDAALAVIPDHAVQYNRGNLLGEMRRFDDALSAYAAAIAVKPDFAEAYKGQGNILFELGRYDEAFAAYDRAFALNPALDYLEGSRLHVKMHLCDWTDFGQEFNRLGVHVKEGRRASEPFMLLPTYATAELQAKAACIFAADRHPPDANPVWRGETYRHKKTRIGYLSGEFREQAVAYVTADLFECHDRNAFEIYGLSTGFDDGSPMRKRLEAAFDRFIDLSRFSDREAAEVIRRAEIDILVNLNGYFGVDRTGICAARPAPVQVNYLGYPGTMGAPYMDYLIADRTVIPEDERLHYSEKVAYMPECYQPADRQRLAPRRRFARAEQGLPETGLVFCCFSTSHKIVPDIFSIWMRLLRDVEDSVLWLASAKATAQRNLRHEAQARGIDPNRIVFARFMPDPKDHLARLSLADLFLDTWPHNAHTTATDAFCAGVPVVTLLGETFPARVAASLLQAVGLPELVTHSLDEYLRLALSLARDPAALGALKAKLVDGRASSSLFDTPRFAKHIEAAYRTMWERQASGLPPESFAVPGE